MILGRFCISKFSLYFSLFYFFYFAFVGIFVIYLPKALLDIGYSHLQIGVLLSALPLCRFLMPFVFLKKLSLTARAFKISLFAVTFLVFLYPIWWQNFYYLLAVTVCFGVFLPILLPFIDTSAMHTLGKSGYGNVRLYGSVGFMAAALLVPHISALPRDIYLMYATMLVLTALFGFFAANHHLAEEQKKDISQFRLSKEPFFWASIFMMQLSFGAFYNFFTVFESEHHIDIETISYLWSFGVVCEIAMFLAQGRILKNVDALKLIKITTGVTVIRWLLLHFFASSVAFSFVSQSFHALSFALYTTAVFVYIFRVYEDKKLAQMFFYGIAYGLGGFVGSLVSGWLYGENLFLFSAIFAAISFALLFIGKRVSNSTAFSG